MMRHDRPETVADLRAERDRAREECGHEKAMRASLRDELYGFIRRYQEQKERAEAAEDEVERLRAEIRDRESERADLRDRVAKAEAEVAPLRRWKAEATEVILGLQDVGKALGLGLGERITGTSATEAAKRLTERAEKAEAQVARVEALHVTCAEHPTCADSDDFCHECQQLSPCTTRRAVGRHE